VGKGRKTEETEKTERTVRPVRTFSVRDGYRREQHAETGDHKEETDEVDLGENERQPLTEGLLRSVGVASDNVSALLVLALAHTDTESEHDGDRKDGDEDAEHACEECGRDQKSRTRVKESWKKRRMKKKRRGAYRSPNATCWRARSSTRGRTE
jgi:hypothetical protein